MANNLFNIAEFGKTDAGAKQLYSLVQSGQIPMQDVINTFGQSAVNDYLARTNQAAPVTQTAPTTPGTTTQLPPPAAPGNLGTTPNMGTAPQLPTNPDPTRYPTPIPAAPNYQAGAAAQGAANLEAAKNTVSLSNPDVRNPYGSQSVSMGPDGRPIVNQSLSPEQQARLNQLNPILSGIQGRIATELERPLGSYVDQPLEAPTLNNLTERQTQIGVGGQSAVADALRARAQPSMDAERRKLENQLLVRGFNPGTEGWNDAMNDLDRRQNDFNLGLTSLSGQEQSRLFDLESALRSQQLNEGSTLFNQKAQRRNQQITEGQLLRGLPIQELGQLLSYQPQLPQFQQYQGTNVEAAPLFNAINAQGLFDLGRYGTMIQGELGTRGIDASKGAANTQLLTNMLGAFI